TRGQRSGPQGSDTVPESWLYDYVSGTGNAGLLQAVTERRKVNSGSWSTVRKVEYSYYDGVAAHGNLGDLKTTVVKDGAGNVLDTRYYRYYVPGEAHGYTNGLKYVFDADSYGRLAATFSNPLTATDAQV